MIDSLRHALHRAFDGVDSVFLAPDIPRPKLTGALSTIGAFLDQDEPVLALYDDTVFGGGSDGFLLTRRRLAWKNYTEQPQQLLFRDLDSEGSATAPRAVVGRIQIAARDTVSRPLQTLLEAIARGEVVVDRTAPPRGDLGDLVTAQFLAAVGRVDDLFYAPHLPRRKERGARRAHADHLPDSEPILVLYDDTVFGSAEEGFVVTPRRLAWKNISEQAQFLPWSAVDPARVERGSGGVTVAAARLAFTARSELIGPVHDAIVGVATGLRDAQVLPAAAGTIRCAFCGRRSPGDTLACPACGAPL